MGAPLVPRAWRRRVANVDKIRLDRHAMISTITRLVRYVWDRALTWISRCGSAVLSNRGLSVLVLMGCAFLVCGPWLRPPISRDFRGVHIPWGEVSSPTFVPEVANQSPRPWRVNSIATQLLVAIAGGIVVVLLRPRWTGNVFGLLLALTIPALVVALWNFPTLIESFESEMRDRALMRSAFRQHSEHMLSAGTPNRLAELGDQSTRKDFLLMHEQALSLPFRYSLYGLWLLGVVGVTAIVAQSGSWSRRLSYAGAWGALGLLLAFAATWPRWLAEYHFARADSLENGRRFAAAAAALHSAETAMPVMGQTQRYWLAKGRLGFRQHQPEEEFQAFFLAHQSLVGGDLDRARALLEPYVSSAQGSVAQRDLLAGIVAQQAAEYAADGKYSGAELSWGEAAAIVPWKSSYGIAHSSAQLIATPRRAAEIADSLLPRLNEIGDLMVASDIHSLIGDAYFETGDFVHARQMYDRAMDLFNLPKFSNIYAQEGRLGM